MGEFLISSEYSSLKINDDDHIFLKSHSTQLRTVEIVPEEIESLRFRKASESNPGYISFHLNDGRILMARFTENEKNQYRQFFLAVRDILLSDEDEDSKETVQESDSCNEETKTVLMQAVDQSAAENAADMMMPENAVLETTAQPDDSSETEISKIETKTAEKPKHRFNLAILIAFILGAAYSIFIICFFSGISGSLITKYSLLGNLMQFNRSFISPHALCAVFATVFSGVALLRNQPWPSLASFILYIISAILFPPYAFFVAIEAILCLIGFLQLKKQKQSEEKNFKTHWIWALDAMLAALAAVAAISLLTSSYLDQKAARTVNGTSASAVPSATEQPSAPAATASASALSTTEYLDAYTTIKLGDTASGGEGGTSYAAVELLLGTPANKLDSSTAEVSSYTCTWFDSTLGENAFFTVTFQNDSAVTKGYSGFSSLNAGEKITADQFASIAADGTVPYSQTVSELGQPDSESETLMDGIDSRYVSWTNVEGDGASVSITFTNGMATNKSSYGLN